MCKHISQSNNLMSLILSEVCFFSSFEFFCPQVAKKSITASLKRKKVDFTLNFQLITVCLSVRFLVVTILESINVGSLDIWDFRIKLCYGYLI